MTAKLICLGSWFSDEGKTLLTALLARAFAKLGRRVLIIDLGIGARNIAFLCNVWPDKTLEHVLSGECGRDDLIVEATAGVDLLSIVASDSRERIGRDEMTRLLAFVNELAPRYEFILVDGPAGAPHWLRPLWQRAHALVTVVSQETLDLDSWRSLQGHALPGNVLALSVINKVGVKAGPDILVQGQVTHLLANDGTDRLPVLLGVIHWSDSLASSMDNGLPLELQAGDTQFEADIAQVAENLMQALSAPGGDGAEESTGLPSDSGDRQRMAVDRSDTPAPLEGMPEDDRKPAVRCEGPADAERWAERVSRLVEAYGRATGERSLGALVKLTTRLDRRGEPGRLLAETILALEREYYARFRRPARWVDEDVLQEQFADGFSEAALLRLHRQLQLSYRMRFKRNLSDPVAELVAQIRAPSYRKQQFFALQHALTQAFARRFGTNYLEGIGAKLPAANTATSNRQPDFFKTIPAPAGIVEERAELLQRRINQPSSEGACDQTGQQTWTAAPIQSVPKLGTEWVIAALALMLAGGAILLRPMLSSDRSLPGPALAPPAVTAQPAHPVVALAEGSLSATPAPASAEVVVSAEMPASNPAAPEREVAADLAADLAVFTEQATEQPAPEVLPDPVERILTVTAQDDCWISIKDRHGRRVAQELLKRGASATYRGDFPMTVTVGNSRVVDIAVNGQALDMEPHRRRKVAHLTVR
jgi:MinD-like ATPase involved in chromosome partitioning or flagellar assembly